MLDSYEENEFIWDESDTRLSNLTDKQLSRVSQKTTPTTNTTASNSSLEKSLSICFSDISSISGPQESSDYGDDHHNSTSSVASKPVNHSSGYGEDNVSNGEELGPGLNFDFDFDVDDERSITGVSRLTSLTRDSISSSSIYSYSGDDRRSKSYSNLKDLENRESQVVAQTNCQLPRWRDDTINCATPKKTGYRVTFEIISARTITTGSSSGVKTRYVSYTIIIKRCPGLESQPGVIERRYTDFYSLYMGLMKRFPMLLKDFSFPKKTLVGNFSSQIIRERSLSFQNLLTYCLSADELRTSRPFIDFLHSKEMMEVRRALKSRNFEDAGNILENCYFIQEKITLQGVNDQSGAQIYQILVLLVTSMEAAGSPQEALTYAQKAIPMILESDFYDHHELTVPFVRLIEQTFECSGKPIDALKEKLAQMTEKGIEIDKSPNLIELIVKKDFTNLTCLRFF